MMKDYSLAHLAQSKHKLDEELGREYGDMTIHDFKLTLK